MSTADLDELASTTTIDLTTIGRRSGRLVRIEIWWFRVKERFVITGTPGPRDWYANVLANPAVIVHANGADHPGVATPILDPLLRRAVFTAPGTRWYRTQAELDALVAGAPMIEITF